MGEPLLNGAVSFLCFDTGPQSVLATSQEPYNPIFQCQMHGEIVLVPTFLTGHLRFRVFCVHLG